MFKVEIRTENASFEDRDEEVARILEAVARQLRCGVDSSRCVDSNGNNVGSFGYDEMQANCRLIANAPLLFDLLAEAECDVRQRALFETRWLTECRRVLAVIRG